jgi:cytochrome c553
MKSLVFITLFMLSLSANAITLDEVYKHFSPDGAAAFDAARGEKIWKTKHISDKGDERQCNACHGDDLTKSGKHVKTKKVIDPMARSVNPERFTEMKKIKKWFRRNCKWTIGRECTDQEKGDLIKYLSQF